MVWLVKELPMPSSRPATGSRAMGSMKERPTRCSTPKILSFISNDTSCLSMVLGRSIKKDPCGPRRPGRTARRQKLHRSSLHKRRCSHYPLDLEREKRGTGSNPGVQAPGHPLEVDSQIEQLLLGELLCQVFLTYSAMQRAHL